MGFTGTFLWVLLDLGVPQQGNRDSKYCIPESDLGCNPVHRKRLSCCISDRIIKFETIIVIYIVL